MDLEKREELIERYLKGSLNDEELKDLMHQIEEDPQLKADVEAQGMILDSLKILQEKQILEDFSLEEAEEPEAGVIKLNQRKWTYYVVAATLTIAVLSFAWLYLGGGDKEAYYKVPVYENDGSLNFVRPEKAATDSTIVAVYTSDDLSGTYFFTSDTLKIYVGNIDMALDMYLLHDPETDNYTLELAGRRYLLEKTESQKRLTPLTNER